MRVVSDPAALSAALSARRSLPGGIGFVPTMGALHEGHVSLLQAARRGCDTVVLSIFVNPTQFNERADFDAYPRDVHADLVTAEAAGVDVAFTPEPAAIYPPGFATLVEVAGPALPLEGEHRPGHFRGVATVVAKLFALVRPDRAYFGQKDYQQLLVVRRLAADLNLGVEVVGCPTVRADDGLALSSRNARLAPDERAAAPVVYASLQASRAARESGATWSGAEEAMQGALAAEARASVEYAVVVGAETLVAPASPDEPLVALVAARFGATRLIDNLLL